MARFVWSVMGEDAGESLAHIVVRKEAERKTGDGEFWWGLGTPLGGDIESSALANGGVLPALFSEPSRKAKPTPSAEVRVWNGWQSVLNGREGKVPKHVLVTSGHDPSKSERPRYALICKSEAALALAIQDSFDPTLCRTARNNAIPGPSQRAALLDGELPHTRGAYKIAFMATLVGPWYVRLIHPTILSSSDLEKIRKYKNDNDWLSLVRQLRQL